MLDTMKHIIMSNMISKHLVLKTVFSWFLTRNKTGERCAESHIAESEPKGHQIIVAWRIGGCCLERASYRGQQIFLLHPKNALQPSVVISYDTCHVDFDYSTAVSRPVGLYE
jgi:hypothetical protein